MIRAPHLPTLFTGLLFAAIVTSWWLGEYHDVGITISGGAVLAALAGAAALAVVARVLLSRRQRRRETASTPTTGDDGERDE